MRTSSVSNVGADKDSEQRQRAAIEGYARRVGHVVVDWFYDAAVSGVDPIETRPGFSALLDRIEANGLRTVLIEDASRFARELVTQELGIIALVARDVQVFTASGDNLTDTDDPSRVMMRQIAGAFAQYEKARLVAKLRVARERKKALTGKCGGRKSYAELDAGVVALAKQLSRGERRMSLREIAAALAAGGHMPRRGKGQPFSASAINTMLRAKPRR